MRVLDSELKNKSIDYNELLKYGFINIDGIYTYKNKICNEQFEMIVIIKDNKITSKLIDLANEDEYILVDIKDTIGEFVGKVREEYENELQNIIAKCTKYNVFKSNCNILKQFWFSCVTSCIILLICTAYFNLSKSVLIL